MDNTLTAREYIILHSINLPYQHFNRIWQFFGYPPESYRRQDFRSSALLIEIYKCLPQTFSSINFSTLRQWENSILTCLTTAEQEILAKKLSERKDIQATLTTVFANYHTHPSSPYIRAPESSSLTDSVVRTEQKKISGLPSHSPMAMSSEKLSNLRSLVSARNK